MSEELLEGWANTDLGACVDVLDSKRVPVNSDERAKRLGPVPYYGATGQVGWIDDYLFDEELLLLGEDGAPFLDKSKPIAYLIGGKSWVNNHAHVLRARSEITTNEFLKHVLNAVPFDEHVNGTTRLKLTQAAMLRIPLRLPPLPEQRRIVAKVEALLARANVARERLAMVPHLLRRFRQSVLAAACSGRLTEDWRRTHHMVTGGGTDEGLSPKPEVELPITWRWAALGKVCKLERGRFSVRPRNDPRYYGGKFPFIQIGDLPPQGGEITAHAQALNDRGREVSKAFPPGTILIAIVGATIGNTGMLMFESCCPDSLVGAQAGAAAVPRYIDYYLRWQKLEIRETSYASGGQPNINLQTLNPYPVALPPVEEQREIVRRVDAINLAAIRAEHLLALVKSKVDKTTQAILAKAFGGELVPTEAELAAAEGREFESAEELLRRVSDGSNVEISAKFGETATKRRGRARKAAALRRT